MKRNIWRWVNLGAFLAMVTVNVLANMLPLGGMTTREISAQYPSPLTPAPVAFMIWSVIYVGLLLTVIYQMTSAANAENGVMLSRKLGPWFVGSCLANMGWIFSWHFGVQTLAMIFMFVLLVTLVFMERKVRGMNRSWKERLMVKAPFSLYFGWMTVATIASVSVWLMSLGFTGLGIPSQVWQAVVVFIGGMIVSVGIFKNRDPLFGLAAMWGYAGILVRQLSGSMLNFQYPFAVMMLFLCEALFLMMIVMVIWPTLVEKICDANLSRHNTMKTEEK